MYKVFLVEDEAFVRKSIKEMIPWDSINLNFCGEAPDGEAAFVAIQQTCPDILITDIKMPFMDGLQLSRLVKKSNPDIKIIILSGYDEFDFAQEALRIGATEYMLKPVRADKLTEVLTKVVHGIEAESREKEIVESLKKELGDNQIFIRERFLNELSSGIITLPEAIEKACGIKIDIIAGYYLVIDVDFNLHKEANRTDYKSDLNKIDLLMSNIMKEYPDVLSFRRNVYERVFILKDNDKLQLREKSDSMAKYIKKLFGDHMDDTSTIFIGSIRERIKGIQKSMGDADTAKDFRYAFKGERIIDFEKVSSCSPEKVEILEFDRSLLTEFLNFGDKNSIGDFLDKLLCFIEHTEIGSFLYVYYTYLDIVITTAKFINSIDGRAEDIITELSDLEGAAVSIHSFYDFKDQVQKILSSALEYRDNKKNNKVGDVIIKTKKYLEDNYSDPDISLISAANFTCVSPNYLSTVFSQDTGVTFSEYLTGLRIKRAKVLLRTTNMRTSEVAYSIGYSNPHYFSFIFKKITGITPKEYRK